MYSALPHTVDICRLLDIISKQTPPCSSVPMALTSSSLPLINNPVQLTPGEEVSSLTPVTSEVPAVVSTITILPQSSSPEAPESEVKRSRVGRPRTKPQKEKREWHQHLGGVRQCRCVRFPFGQMSVIVSWY